MPRRLHSPTRILSRGELIDHRTKRGGGGILCRGDGADLIVGLLQRGRALLELFGVAADLGQRLCHRQQRVGGLVDSVGKLLGPGGELSRSGPRSVQAGGQLAGAVVESAGPVGGLFDPGARRNHHGQHLIDRLPGYA